LELVPNISEGRDPAVVEAVVRAFCQPGVHRLDVDGSRGAHRTVITLAGPADALVQGAIAGAREAMARIDLRHHHGVHPRMGALDVCPFVALAGADPSDAITAARVAAERIGALGLPGWLYGDAATAPAHRRLQDLRRGQFEGLAARMAVDPPDFGPPVPHPTAGAVAVGARFFLVAFNVALGTTDVRVARRVARAVREWRSVRRDAAGRVVSAERGRLREVRALGWYVEDFGCAQVSTNLTDYRVTPPHVLMAAVREEAEARGVSVTGSELVGCVPLEALRLAARASGLDPAAPEDEQVARAVEVLGLDALAPFDPARKVLEWAVAAARSG